MEDMVRIQKGSVVNVVPINAYNSIYKPKGWEIIEEQVENEIDKELKYKGIVNEKQQNAYVRAKQEKAKRHFDDGLFKGE